MTGGSNFIQGPREMIKVPRELTLEILISMIDGEVTVKADATKPLALYGHGCIIKRTHTHQEHQEPW